MIRRSVRTALAVTCLVGLASGAVACGDEANDLEDVRRAEAAAATTAPTSSDLAGTIKVMAATPLTDAFDELVATFEEVNPNVTVEVDYGSSSSMRDLVLADVPADVFASAGAADMDAVAEDGGLSSTAETFATDRLAIAVPAGNEAGVNGLDDFDDEPLVIGLCVEGTPCGDAGRQALAGAGVRPAPDTDEPDGATLLEKVASGELDAGLAFVTDVQAAGDRVEAVEIPSDQNVVTEPAIGALAGSTNPVVAESFVAFVMAGRGQNILASHGFGPPP